MAQIKSISEALDERFKELLSRLEDLKKLYPIEVCKKCGESFQDSPPHHCGHCSYKCYMNY